MIFGITYAFAASVQPGPFQTYIISQTLSRGWRPTLPASFAPLISDVPIIILALLLLKNMPPWTEHLLQFAGGLFLFYLAYNAYKTWRNYDAGKIATPQSNKQTLLRAATVNLLNPNPYLGWSLIMGPLFLKGWQAAPANGIALILSFYSTMIFCLAGIIMIFALARNLGPKVNRVSVGISVIALACFGLYELWLGTTGFWL